MNNNDTPSLLPKEPLLASKKPFVQLIFLLLFVIGGMLIFSAIGLVCATLLWGSDITSNPTAAYYRLIQVFSAVGTFLVPALLFSFSATRRWFGYSSADKVPSNGRMFLYVLLLAFFLIPLVGYVAYLNEQIRLPEALAPIEKWMQAQEESTNHVIEVILSATDIPTFLLNLLICAAVPAICEEFFFRGTLQTLFSKWTGRQHLSIWLTGFIFSAIHLQFSGFFARWLLGAYLGYLFWWSGSIWIPVVAHFLHNALYVTAQLLVVRGVIADEQSVTFAEQFPAVVASAILAGAFIALVRYSTKGTAEIEQ
ncbi:MAG: CPBP family intramembrane metalloprotease [Bacteroidales bacterium]|nr:CPBP family intramembrane metalloprotease [Bacteroidales bacterium]